MHLKMKKNAKRIQNTVIWLMSHLGSVLIVLIVPDLTQKNAKRTIKHVTRHGLNSAALPKKINAIKLMILSLALIKNIVNGTMKRNRALTIFHAIFLMQKSVKLILTCVTTPQNSSNAVTILIVHQ